MSSRISFSVVPVQLSRFLDQGFRNAEVEMDFLEFLDGFVDA